MKSVILLWENHISQIFFSHHCQNLKSNTEQHKLQVSEKSAKENILTENDEECRQFKSLYNEVVMIYIALVQQLQLYSF
jgi:hypothetical protein